MRLSPILLAAAGIALLAAMDAVIKHLSLTHAVAAVVCGSFWCRVPFAAAHWLSRGSKPISGAMWRFHALRGLVVAFAAYGFFLGVDRLPLAEAITLSFIAPLAIPFIAWAALAEQPRRGSLVAAAVGFGGVIIAVSGDAGASAGPERSYGIAATLVGAMLFAISLTLLRARAGQDGPARVNFLGSIYPALVMTPLALVTGGDFGWGDLPWLLLAGLFGAAGMALYAEAYGRAQAQQLAPLEYSALLWAAIFGLVFFAEVPRVELAMGAALIVMAGLIAARDERQARRAAGTPLPID